MPISLLKLLDTSEPGAHIRLARITEQFGRDSHIIMGAVTGGC